MSSQAYLIDTNVIIDLEDNHAVQPALAQFVRLCAKHKIDVFVHAASRDDAGRDRDTGRREIFLSKLGKFQVLERVRGLDTQALEDEFGSLTRANDVVDATLLHSVLIGAVDFLVTQDRGLHERARQHSSTLGGRVLFVADALELLKTTFEPVEANVRYIKEISAHTIPLDDDIFVSLREDYSDFDTWWRDKCVRNRRPCWVVEDPSSGLAGLVVRKDETADDTDATIRARKILKICTFKVRPENRGVKLGELLLKKVLWFAQLNAYDLAYVTTFSCQVSLIDLVEYYGFVHTATKRDGEHIYEKEFSQSKLDQIPGKDIFETDRLNYPRFVTSPHVRAFGVPIREAYHDVLYPELMESSQLDLFGGAEVAESVRRPGNTIRKVYLCRAQSNLGPPGSLLVFYKGKSRNPPSQAWTAVGILEGLSVAASTADLMQMTGGRSVFSEVQLSSWGASEEEPVKVINYLLAGYLIPPVGLQEAIVGDHPPQSICEIDRRRLPIVLQRIGLGL